MQPLEIALPLAVAFATALLLSGAVGRVARAVGAVDRPTLRGVNARPDMPLWGGLAVASAVALGMAADLLVSERPTDAVRVAAILGGGGLLIATGLWDDRFGMRAWPKLAVQLVAASVAVASGFQIVRFTDPFSMQMVDLPLWLVWPLSLLWIVGVTNAMNLLDGLDGLAAGVGAIIGGTLTLIAWQADSWLGVALGLSLVGALLGFLPHNFAPARIFLGDTGSLFLGFTLSLLALEGYRRISLITFVVPLLALAVPLLDTALSIVRRLRSGTPVFSADRLHMHHRLLDAEGSPRRAVLQFYLLTAAFCLIALSFTRLQGISAAVFLVAVAALTLRLLWNLGALNVQRETGEGDDA